MSEGLRECEQGGDTGLFALPGLVSAAHELKSPLATIRQLALLLETDTNDAEQARLYAHRLRLNSERVLRLASDITHASRLEDALFASEPVNPVAFCNDVAAQLAALYEARGRHLIVVRRRPAPLVVANRDLLGRILVNFADNALHYAPESGVVRLDVTASHHGDRVRIGVRDYGPGVAADVWRRLTATKPNPIARRPESSGLGLYLSKQFAEAMGARIGVTRHRDGASFYVELSGSTQVSLL